jgi:hypothetical protein
MWDESDGRGPSDEKVINTWLVGRYQFFLRGGEDVDGPDFSAMLI